MALQTHPDRLPPNVSTAEKRAAEEQFTKVNNAYEVLSDMEKRQVRIWVPYTHRHRSRSGPPPAL